MAMRKNWKGNIAELALWIVGIILVNLFFSTRYFRIDLTDEKRYTLAPITKQFLRGFEKDVMVKVYLDGDLNAGFRRLSRATRETLEEFRIVSRGKLYYQFVDPKEEPVALEELKNLDLSPVSLFETTSDGRRIQSNIYPYANFHIEGYELTVNLLENLPGLSGEANLNLSVEALEYKITDVMRRLLTEDTPAIAFLEGHGELDEIDVYDVTEALSHYYQVDRGSLTSDPYILDVYKALIIAKPRFKFSESDKFVLDQYVMRGGKVLWLIDAVQVTLDSLRTATQTVGMSADLGLSDLLFRYGIRINQELVQDVQAAMIPVNVAGPGEQPKFVPVPWMFNPLLSTNSSHPVTRSVNLVRGEFVSSIDTVGVFPGVKRDILLQTSQNARRLPIPVFISLAMVNEQPNSRDFVNAFVPVAVSMEGVFPSLYLNRPKPPEVNISPSDIRKESVPSRMIVIADGDIIRNEVRMRHGPSPQILPLGFDEVGNQTFGNKDLIINAVHYLADDEGWMNLRTRDYRLRMLDREKLANDIDFWKWANLLLPLVFMGIIGAFFSLWRRGKYGKTRDKKSL